MQKTLKILAALVVVGTMVMPSAAALTEFFNDETIRSPEPNAFERSIAGPAGYWSNVFHSAADEDARLGPGMFALLHGAGAETGDWDGTSTTADAKPYLDFIHTNYYGVIIMSDPNDATGAVFEQRFSYPGFIAFTAMYGYYNEKFDGSTAISGSPMKGPKSKGAVSINDPCWTGHPDFVEGACVNKGATGGDVKELSNDEFVYIYKGAGGPAADVRDRFNLDGTTMVYSQVIETTAVASVSVCSVAPCDALDAAHPVYDLFDQDCTADGGADNYADKCENKPVVALWDQKVSCGGDDDDDRALRGDAEHSNGNGGVCVITTGVPNFPLGDATPDTVPQPIGGIVVPDDNSPQQASEEFLKTRRSCYAAQFIGTPEEQQRARDTSGCQSVNGHYEETIRQGDSLIPNHVDTPSRPAYRTPPTPEAVPPQVTYSFADTRRAGTLDSYTGGLVQNLRGSLLEGLHIVTWVGPANEIDAQGNLVSVVEGPNGWKSASLRDVDYFTAAGEDARPLQNLDKSAIALACFLEGYLVHSEAETGVPPCSLLPTDDPVAGV